MADAPAAPVSPTGAPTLGQKLIKAAIPFFGVVALVAGAPEAFAAAGAVFPDVPWLHVAVAVAKGLVGLGVVLGIASQGARKEAAVAAGAAAGKAPGAGDVNAP